MTTSLSSVRPMTMAGLSRMNSLPAKFVETTTTRPDPAASPCGTAAGMLGFDWCAAIAAMSVPAPNIGAGGGPAGMGGGVLRAWLPWIPLTLIIAVLLAPPIAGAAGGGGTGVGI